jgi:hypothetical protein
MNAKNTTPKPTIVLVHGGFAKPFRGAQPRSGAPRT